MRARKGRSRPWIAGIVVLAALGAAGFGVYHFRKARAGSTYPGAQARKGDFQVLVTSGQQCREQQDKPLDPQRLARTRQTPRLLAPGRNMQSDNGLQRP